MYHGAASPAQSAFNLFPLLRASRPADCHESPITIPLHTVPQSQLCPASVRTSACLLPCQGSSEVEDAASGNRETSTTLGLLILPWWSSPTPRVRASLVGNLRPAQEVTISSSNSAKRDDIFLHTCLSSTQRPLLVIYVQCL